jgi:probable rRNA maturation factor
MRSYQIDVQQKEKVALSLATAVRNAVNTTLRHEAVRLPASVAVLLTNDEQLRHMNKSYRGIDAPTDVLSFPAGESMPGMEEAGHLGDIAISIPTAKRQAYAGNHSLKSELLLLAVHGTLHLLGYDHEEAEDKTRMWWVQASILAQLGAEITGPPETEDE